MSDHDDLAAGLPAPRDDEPRELRQDIIDELADHLHCAVNRERLLQVGAGGTAATSSGDNSTDEAQRAALEKFGNPAKIARRLWWDAMQERIMTQRAKFFVSAAGGALVALAAMFVAQMIVNLQTLQATVADLQRQLADKNAPIAATLPKTEEPEQRFPFSVKLVDEAGKPVKGQVQYTYSRLSSSIGAISIAPSGASNAAPSPIAYDIGGIFEDGRTSPEGVVDFGQRPAGSYLLTVRVDGASYSTSIGIQVGPNEGQETTVVCPGALLVAPLHFEITPPESLAKENLYYLAELRRTGFRFAGRQWSESGTTAATVYLLDSKGSVLTEYSPVDVGESSFVGGGISGGVGYTITARGTLYVGGLANEITCQTVMHESAGLPAGVYDLVLVPYRFKNQGIATDVTKETLVKVAGHEGALSLSHVVNLGNETVCRIGTRDRDEVSFWRGVRLALNPPAVVATQPSASPSPYRPQPATAYPTSDYDPVAPPSRPPPPQEAPPE